METFIEYCSPLLGIAPNVTPLESLEELDFPKVSEEQCSYMVRPVTLEEIKATIFGIEDDKALGPDGFSSKIFKAT